MRFHSTTALLALTMALASLPASADAADAQAAPAPEPEPQGSRSLALAASVVPGLLLHGSGHYALGETEAAKRILLAEGLGLGSFVGGMAVLIASGGSEKVAPLYVIPAVGGASVFFMTWLADVAGVGRGTRQAWPEPWRAPGTLHLSAGYSGLFGTSFDFEHNLNLAATWRGERWWTTPAALFDPVRFDYAAVSDQVGYTLWRPAGDPVDELSAVLFGGHQRFGGEGFSITTFELYADSRWNLRRLSPTLRNAWFRARLGAGVEALSFDSDPGHDVQALLVAGFGMGLRPLRSLSLELDYWQSKNDLPGGLVVPGGFDGFFGVVELHGRLQLADRWAVVPAIRYGTGVMTSLSLEARAW